MAKQPNDSSRHKKPLSPAQLVDQSDIAQKLTKLGATTADLSALLFSKFDPDLPFYMWALVGPDWLVVKHHSLCKAYCALRWLVAAQPSETENTRAAWEYISQVLSADLYRLAVQTKENQKIRAAKTRVSVGDRPQPFRKLAETLATHKEHRDLSATELWPLLRSAMHEQGMDPIDISSRGGSPAYTYDYGDGRRQITQGRFANLVSEIRRKSR